MGIRKPMRCGIASLPLARTFTVHATCEDYRAGATLDFEIDREDHGRRRIACPTLVLYGGAKGRRPSRRRDMLEVWREWATDVRVRALECGHFIPEEAPDETVRALGEFFAGDHAR
jgi:haloacetate dehalogenase